jgi:hypothetical protein
MVSSLLEPSPNVYERGSPTLARHAEHSVWALDGLAVPRILVATQDGLHTPDAEGQTLPQLSPPPIDGIAPSRRQPT